MKSIGRAWKIFAFVLILAIAGMALVSKCVIDLEQNDTEIRELALYEDYIRTALYRMDNKVASMISFSNWTPTKPASYQIDSQNNAQYVSCMFSVDEKKNLTIFNENKKSKEKIPVSELDGNLLSNYVQKINGFNWGAQNESVAVNQLKEIEQAEQDVVNNDNKFLNVKKYTANKTKYSKVQQKNRGQNAYSYRRNEVQQRLSSSTSNVSGNSSSSRSFYSSGQVPLQAQQVALPEPLGFANLEAIDNVMTPFFVKDNLYLCRQIQSSQSGQTLQGSRLDWPAIKKILEDSCDELLPNMQLVPLVDADEFDRRLASLPVTIIPGELPSHVKIVHENKSDFILGIAWSTLLLAFTASGFLLHGANNLSKRRSTFVSAVTHELRTPLTTFRMYTDLLLSGKLNEDKTQNYLKTMSYETDRLTHMVENVLAFSKLENRNANVDNVIVTIDSILSNCFESLENRCVKDKMILSLICDEKTKNSSVKANPAAVEHILFNLVDNACKYAAGSENKNLQLSVVDKHNEIHFALKDFGPGVEQEDRLFKAFSKSAADAAQSKPGIGLGLALCKQFAKEMSADLIYIKAKDAGSVFTLKLKKT